MFKLFVRFSFVNLVLVIYNNKIIVVFRGNRKVIVKIL